MRKLVPFFAGIVVGIGVTIGIDAMAGWNDRSGMGGQPDTALLEKLVRAGEDIARDTGQVVRHQGEMVRALNEGASVQKEMARALAEIKRLCK